jgi:trk system potassium uptake protein TrkH
MLDFRPVLYVVGAQLVVLAVTMLAPAAVEIYQGTPDWRAFVFAGAATLFFGGALVLATYSERAQLGLRQSFLMTTLCWVSAAWFGALPFVLMGNHLSITDAFFESMSAITTTGSTVMTGLDHAAPGILLWRGLLQWIGGIGIIVTAVAMLPMLQVGGMQLFRTESSDRSQKVLPRTAQLAVGIAIVYGAMSAALVISLYLAGMTLFNAVVHAMTTISTGGFSTTDQSIAAYSNPAIHWIIIVGMIAGAMPFLLFVSAMHGNVRALVKDTQVRWFLVTLAVVIAGIALAEATYGHQPFWIALRLSAFNVTSIISGTGFATAEYDRWGNFAPGVFFTLMFIGGCAGSASCGIKIFRFQILFAAAGQQIKRLIRPHGVFIAHYNRTAISTDIIESVMAFVLVYMACFATLTITMGVLGLDLLTAASASATTMSNVGPGLGEIVGPAGTFASLPAAAKWVLSAGMLLGRLEFFTVLVLFAPSFWRD